MRSWERKLIVSEKHSGELGQFKVSLVLTLAVAAAILLVLLLFYFRQDPQATQAAAQVASNETGVAQPLPPPQSEAPAQDLAQTNRQSEEAAKQVLGGLKRFQGATESNMSYEEYDDMLTRLKADLHDTLPTFVRHNPSDEAFRQEVAAALRDYTAAGDWWKTTIRNSSVLKDADRDERVQPSWRSAQTHLENAEKDLLR
jgi:cytoskeletal protein RodZ